MYAENLKQAARRFEGQKLTTENGLQLVESLLGTDVPDQSQSAGGALGSLLGGLLGDKGAEGEGGGLDAGDLLTAGMAFLNAKQQGDTDMEAVVDAVVAASNAGQTEHRAKSGSIVANTLLQAVMNK